MTDAYFVHDDNYDAMKKDRDSFNRNIERNLAEAEDEDKELSEILSTFSSAPPATCKTIGLKPMIIKKQLEES